MTTNQGHVGITWVIRLPNKTDLPREDQLALADRQRLGQQKEVSHAAAAGLHFMGFVTMSISLIVRVRYEAKRAGWGSLKGKSASPPLSAQNDAACGPLFSNNPRAHSVHQRKLDACGAGTS